jgi:hypothetical protein
VPTVSAQKAHVRVDPLLQPTPPMPPVLPARAPAKRMLGRPASRVFLMDRQGTRVVADLTDSASFIQWSRALDDVSELELSLHLRGDALGRACAATVREVHTWHHELIVVRGGEAVWGPGPIVTKGPAASRLVHLVARDVVAWLDVRLVHNDYTWKQADVTEIARTCIADALTKGLAATMPFEQADVGILRSAVFYPAGKPVDYEVKANQQTAGEILRDLATKGLNFTCLNRALIVGGDFGFGPVGPLRDDDFEGDLEVTEHGLAAADHWFVTGGVGKQGEWGGVDGYYGLIESGVEGEAATENDQELSRLAYERWTQGFPPPVTVNVPADGSFAPDAPVSVDDLIPGMLVDLELRETSTPIHTLQRITAVQAQTGDNGPEKIAATLAPPSGALTA